MNTKGLPIYGVTSRPLKHLTDAELKTRRDAAIQSGKMSRDLLDLNNETVLRKMLAEGAVLK